MWIIFKRGVIELSIPICITWKETEMLKHLAKAREDGVGREGYGARAARHGDAANRSAGLEVGPHHFRRRFRRSLGRSFVGLFYKLGRYCSSRKNPM